MESISAEICEDLEKRDGRGRRLLSKEQWVELFSAYESSGMTQRAFCRRECINYNSFIHQLSKHRGKSAPKFRQLQLRPTPERSFTLEVALPCGSVVRGQDSEQLAALIRLLRD